jgi:hypothetical protein
VGYSGRSVLIVWNYYFVHTIAKWLVARRTTTTKSIMFFWCSISELYVVSDQIYTSSNEKRSISRNRNHWLSFVLAFVFNTINRITTCTRTTVSYCIDYFFYSITIRVNPWSCFETVNCLRIQQHENKFCYYHELLFSYFLSNILFILSFIIFSPLLRVWSL